MTSAFLLTTWSMKPGSWWRKAVVVLPPDVRGEQIFQRSDRPSPGDVPRGFEPFGVLVEHRVDDVDEGLVAREEAVPAGEQIALQPALALVLAEHFHHAAGRRQVVVGRRGSRPSRSCRSLRRRRPGGSRPSRPGPKRRKLRWSALQLHHVAEEAAHDARRLGLDGAGLRHVDGVVAEVGQPQVAQQQAAVGVRVGAHAPLALRRQLGQFGHAARRSRRTAPPAL